MFKDCKPTKFVAGKFAKLGEFNPQFGTYDYCVITIWSAGDKLQRYKRLKDTILRVAPLESDQCFRVSHDAKSIYYMGQQDDKKKLVIVWLKDLTHNIVDLGAEAAKIETLEDSSLFKHYLCYATKRKVVIPEKTRDLWHYTKDFHVIDLIRQHVVWTLNDCEKLFFVGREASKMPSLTFTESKVKLRPLGDVPSDDEGDQATEWPLTLEETDVEVDSEPLNAEIFDKYFLGILAVKTTIQDEEDDKKDGDEDEKVEEEKKEDEKVEEEKKDEKGDEKEPTKKVVTRKYVNAYAVHWKRPIDERLKCFSHKFDVTKTAADETGNAQDKRETVTSESNKQEEGRKLMRLEENPILIVTDHNLRHMFVIVKGLKGD